MATATLQPQSLLRDVEDGSILSFRHRAIEATDEGLYEIEVGLEQISQQIRDGALERIEDVEPDIPTCRECGCTEAFACQSIAGGHPCSWAVFTPSTNRLLCTACAGKSSC